MLKTITNFVNNPSVSKLRTIQWVCAGLLLLIPTIAMQFTTEMNWGLGDFVILAAMLAFAIIGFEVATKFLKSRKHLAYVGLAIAAAFLFVWAELAVGIIG